MRAADQQETRDIRHNNKAADRQETKTILRQQEQRADRLIHLHHQVAEAAVVHHQAVAGATVAVLGDREAEEVRSNQIKHTT